MATSLVCMIIGMLPRDLKSRYKDSSSSSSSKEKQGVFYKDNYFYEHQVY